MRKSGWFSLVALVLGGCVLPAPHGPYYQPIYPDMDESRPGSGWLPSSGKAGGSSNRLRIGLGMPCHMEISALSDTSNFLLSWRFERRITPNRECVYQVGPQPLVLEDIDAGRQYNVTSVRRIFPVTKPTLKLSHDESIEVPDLVNLPVQQRTYTISLPLKHEFKGKLPEAVAVQLPEVRVGDVSIQPPVLNLKKFESGGNVRAYLPVDALPLTNTNAIRDFGMRADAFSTRGSLASFNPGVSLWYEKNGLVRIATSFSGRDDPSPPFWVNPFIWGEIHIQVLSDSRISLPNPRVQWSQGPEVRDKATIQIDPSRWQLTMYATTPNDELQFHGGPHDTHFIATLPTAQPRHVRAILPSLSNASQTWPIKPIQFEYRDGGLGVSVWP
jgi:hypothetical protein